MPHRALDGDRGAGMRGHPAADRVGGLDARRHFGIGHHRDVGQGRLGADVARDVELDGVDALAQAEPRHLADLVGTVDRDAEALRVEMQLPAVAQPAGHGELGARRQQARPVDHALLDRVAHHDVEADLGRRAGDGAGEARAQQLAAGVHGHQRVILRRQLAQRGAARRVDEGQMGMALDHARHQELSRRVEPLGAGGIGQRLGLRRHRRDPVVLDQHLAGKRRQRRCRPRSSHCRSAAACRASRCDARYYGTNPAARAA